MHRRVAIRANAADILTDKQQQQRLVSMAQLDRLFSSQGGFA